jgi:hypothetical protein
VKTEGKKSTDVFLKDSAPLNLSFLHIEQNYFILYSNK